MNYIINPIWFYLIELSNKANKLAITISIICFFGTLVVYLYEETENTHNNSGSKKFLIASALTCILYIFIPSEDACKEMIVSSLVTEENLSYTKEEAKEFVDYIFEKIEGLQNEDSD